MKVLHVLSTFSPDSFGGIEASVSQLCFSLNRLGVENRVFTLSVNPYPKVIELSGIKIFRSKQNFKLASTRFSFQSIAIFKELVEWADIIHYNYPWPFADLLHFVSGVNKKTVVTYHSDIIKQKKLKYLYKPLQNAFLRDVSKIVCTSLNYAQSSSSLKSYQEKLEVIPIGINEETYPEPSDAYLNDVEKIVGDDFFLFVGVLRHYKGLDYLIKSIQNLPFKIVVIGDGPLERKLKKLANNLGVYNVHFVGGVTDEDKAALFKLSRAVVFPSVNRAEAFGVTLVEGLMYGKALISTELGTGTSYVNLNGKTGIVVEPRNSLALTEALLKLYYDSLLTKEMEYASRLRYEKLFTSKVMAQKYFELYKSL
jgi:glycosyltransferase involved in cell wall biosynthesis